MVKSTVMAASLIWLQAQILTHRAAVVEGCLRPLLLFLCLLWLLCHFVFGGELRGLASREGKSRSVTCTLLQVLMSVGNKGILKLYFS